MQVEVVKKPSRPSRSNADWLEISTQFEALEPKECLRITGLTQAKMKSLRQQAYREVRARSFTRIEQSELVLYLHKS